MMGKDRARAVLSVSIWMETFSQPYIHPWEPPEAVGKTACRPDGSVGDCEALETGVLK